MDGCREYVAGRTDAARDKLSRATHLADAAFLAGFLAINAGHLDTAERHLRAAESGHRRLGQLFDKYGLAVELALPITELVIAHIHPSRRGVLLGLAEIHQARQRIPEAIECLKKLRRDDPSDVVVNLSVAELICETYPDNERLAKQVVALAGDVRNDSSVHAGLMLYKARALRTLGLTTAARDELTAALRKRKDRDAELLRAIRYERAGVYEQLGRKARARGEYEKLYADDPSYEDVADRLGL